VKQDWRIWAESTPAPESALDRLQGLLEADPRALGPIVGGRIGTASAVFLVEAESLSQAVVVGAELYEEALAELDLNVSPLRIEAEPEDYEPAQLIGATDVGRVLGVTRQRVYQLAELYADFPSPVSTPSRGALWDSSAIRAWAAIERPEGRPTKELDRPDHHGPGGPRRRQRAKAGQLADA
jgi:predicted DNA-binding transcriptional regulator AlpA